ncbi:MAG: arginine--tRNA ligase [Ferruginibacter sp.]
MSIVEHLQQAVISVLSQLYSKEFSASDFQVNQTKPEFTGDYSIVLFSLIKKTGQPLPLLAEALGSNLKAAHPGLIADYNVIKGFLNLNITDAFWLNLLNSQYNDICFGKQPMNGQKVMVEYSSPNTNKPLHLGHLRNNFLGWSVAEILKATGNEVFKSCIVNDRGIHICKSMLAWQKHADGATPASTGKKGDHFVGDYYVRFEQDVKEETEQQLNKVKLGDLSSFADNQKIRLEKILVQLTPLDEEKNGEAIKKIQAEVKEFVRNHTPVMNEARDMLLKWEQGDEAVMALWNKMNAWVYEGFDKTYQDIGSDFDKKYYESQTYLLGKDFVQQGLDKGVFFKKEDGSVWIDLKEEGLDEKLVLRKDGTSVYITQDIGLVMDKYQQFKIDQSIYVIADEQNYHMKVLQVICKKLGLPVADGIEHLSYGMVELPSGKMKSREGTVVDADDMVEEMVQTARKHTEELGKVNDFSGEDLEKLYKTLGMGAMKFYLLRVDPKKRMVFNPEESIDFHGYTGPFVQYTYARIKSILRKLSPSAENEAGTSEPLLALEKELLITAEQFPTIILQAAKEMNPSVVANYCFTLAKTFNSFYAVHSVANAETGAKKLLRERMCRMTANILKSGMQLLGIDVPEQM